METKWPPEPTPVIADLADPLRLIHQALAHGADEGVKHHESRKRPVIDPWLYSHIARNEAKQFLINAGIEDLGFQPADLAMSGLYLRGASYEIRILKVGHTLDNLTGKFVRGVPSPDSWSRREYFQQTSLGLDDQLFTASRPLRLVVLWDHDPLHQLSSIEVACTRRWNPSRNCVETHWLVPVDIAATDLGIGQVLIDEPILLEDHDVREKDDLDRAANDGR